MNSRRSTRLARRGLPLTLLSLVVVAFSFSALAASNSIDTSNAGQENPQLAGAPAIIAIAPGDVQLSVQFDPPGNSATAGITTYQYTTDNGVTWKTRATGTTASPLVITTVSGGSGALVNGTTYPVRLRAVNAAGAGLVSNRSDSAPRTVPDAPPLVTAAADDAHLSIDWELPLVNGGSVVTGYRVQIRTSPAGTWGDPSGSCAFATTGTSTALGCDATGLTNGTAYDVRVAAVNAAGEGAYSSPVGPFTPVAATPGAPTSVLAVPDDQQATVSWDAPADLGGLVITGYQVTSSPGGFTCSTDGALSCVVTGLTNGTAYTFTVAATTAGGFGPDSAASASVTPHTVPDVPTGLVATPGEQTMGLTWTAPASNGGSPLSGYTVNYRAVGAPTWTSVGAATTSATVTGLTVGVSYEFKVAAVNVAAGAGSFTAAVTADGSTAWGPEDLGGGLALWFDADDATTFTLAGTAVSDWVDKSGHLRSAAQGTSANRPTLATASIGSRSSVDFDGSDDSLPFDGSALANTDYTVAVAAARGSNATGNRYLGGTASATNANLSLGWSTNTALIHAQYGNDYTLTVSGYTGTPTAEVHVFRQSSATGKSLWRNGGGTAGAASATSADTAALSAWTGSSLGRAATNYFDGGIGEVVITADALSTTDRQRLEGYLAHRWGTSASLPADHPYKSLPPFTSTPATAPDVPTSLQSAAGNQSMTLSWTAPAANGTPVTDYVVEYKQHGTNTWSTFADGRSTSASATVTGLTIGVSYDFRVAATNAVGTGSWSATVTSTAVGVPSAPTALAATPGDQTMALTWSAPASNGSALTDYVVEYSVSGSGSWTTFADGTSTTSSATVTGLTAGTAYDFRVAGVNAIGTGTASSTVTATAITTPGAPTALAATPGDQTMALSWTAPSSNGSSAITDYVVQYQASGAGSWTTFADGTSTTTSATVTGLTAGTAYEFRIAATNAAGTGTYSTTTTATAITTPGTPTALAATPGDQTMALSWTAPSSNGSSAIIDYVVQYQASGAGSWTTFADGTSTTTSATVTGLTAGTAYNFRVAAINAAGTGTYSTTTTATAITTPGAPTALAATPGDQTMALSWTAPSSNGSSAITDYVVQYQASGAGSWTTFADGTSTTTSATVTGLTAGTSYEFRVAAINAAGTGTYSTTTTATAITTPGAPTALAATPGDQTMSLTWTAPASNGSSAITDYSVQYRVSGAPTWTLLSRATSTTTSATVTGLTAGTSYEFRVAAINAAGTGTYSTTTTATAITTPGAPTALAATPGDQTMALSWTAPSSNGSSAITDYSVQYRVSGAPTWTLLSRATSTTTSATVTGLTAGTSYEFRVAAINAAGTGTYSTTTTATAITTPGAPTALAATPGDQTMALSWTAPSSNGSSAITDYVVQYQASGAGSWTTFADGTSTTTSATVTGLTAGTAYNFRIAATNTVGTGTYSSTVTATAITTPGAPTALAATAGDTTMALSWTAPASNGSSAITDYSVQYRATGAPTWTLLSRATSATTTATVTGLTAGTSYDFRVAAINAAGTGTYSSTVTATAITTPGAPTALAATVGDTTMALTWTAPSSNGSSAITDYTVQYRIQNAATWTTFADGTSTTASATVTGLTAGTAYDFRVAAVNAAGTGTYSSTVTATANATPGAPTSFTATAASQAATLSWTAPASNGGTSLTDYVVQYRLQGAGTWSTFADGTSTTASATVTGLTSGSTYEFQVAGVNVLGTGTYSATATATAQYPWNPNYLSTLAMWLDADDSTTFTLSGSAVSQWTDKSGNGYSVSQATSANQPLRTAAVMGGRAAVVFDGSNDSLALSTTTLLNSTNYTVAAAVARTSNKSNNPYLGGTAITNLASLSLGWSADTTLAASTAGTLASAELSATVAAYSSAVDEIHVTSYSSTAGRNLWSQGGTVSATATGSTSAITSWSGASLGRHSSAYFAGRIGEFVIVTSALSTSDRQMLEGYLANKWGTTASLPANHPYKSIAPGTATAPNAPSAPTGVTASVSGTTATVSWTAPSSAATVRSYTVTSSPGGLTCTATTATTCNVTGLTGGTSYTFTVTATSGFGTGSASAASNSVTAQSAPGAPTGLAVTAVTTTSITVSWTAPVNNGGSAITGYTVAVSGQGNPPNCTPSPATATSCTITGLNSGKTYNMSVTATNAFGTSAASATVSQKTN